MQVFGLLGLLISDLCLNFGSISYPAYRVLSLLMYAVMWLISSFRGGSAGVNHVAHIIGLIVGATWGSLYLPSLPMELMELASPCAGVAFETLHYQFHSSCAVHSVAAGESWSSNRLGDMIELGSSCQRLCSFRGQLCKHDCPADSRHLQQIIRLSWLSSRFLEPILHTSMVLTPFSKHHTPTTARVSDHRTWVTRFTI